MPVLADFRDKDAGTPPLVFDKRLDQILDAHDGLRAGAQFPRIDAGNCRDPRAMAAKHVFERKGYFADRRLGPRRIDRERQKTGGSARAFRQGIKSALNLAGVPLGLQMFELGDLPRANGGRIDFQNLNVFLDLGFEPVDPDHCVDPAVDACLGLCGRFLDAEFGMPASIAFAMPPIASISSICAKALLARAAVSRST